MNLLMILLIVLAIWVGAAICYFAWRLTPDVPGTPEPGSSSSAGSEEGNENGGP